MKILVSAIACDPCSGSEGGIGWGWVRTLAGDHEVYCLTDMMNRRSWEKAKALNEIPASVEVRFIGKDVKWHPNRLIARVQSWLRFLAFNRRVLEEALDWHNDVGFDLAHQVTYATWRVPSPLWKLPVPFVWGPIGGFSTIPRSFRGMLGWPAKMLELARDQQTRRTLKSKAFLRCLENSSYILAANKETYEGLRALRGERAMSILPSAFLPDEKIERFKTALLSYRKTKDRNEPVQLFAGGNIEGRKGVDLALHALSRVKAQGIDFRYEVCGGGPEVRRLEALSVKLGLSSEVSFRAGYEGEEYLEKLVHADIYFLPSFRETTPVTLLESMLAACFPIVVNASAAGEMVSRYGGIAVPANSPDKVIEKLADSIVDYRQNLEKFRDEANEIPAKVIADFRQERFIKTANDVFEKSLKSYQERS